MDMDSKNKTYGYILLETIEREVEAADGEHRRLSLECLCRGMAVDVVLATGYFGELLTAWRQCLPLGEVSDVTFSQSASRLQRWISVVTASYRPVGVKVDADASNREMLTAFREWVAATADSADGQPKPENCDVATVLVSALHELSDTLTTIARLLAKPTVKQIARSFERWKEFHKMYCSQELQEEYDQWKVQYPPRLLRRHLKERMVTEKEAFRQLFHDADEFEQVFDSECNAVDDDGLGRFLFTHSDRFGSSSLRQPFPYFSDQLRRVFDFVALWDWLRADLTPESVRKKEEAKSQTDAMEVMVMGYVEKVQHLVTDGWKPRHHDLWQKILKTFRKEITRASPHEMFKEFSKKTVCCILGHLKQHGVYEDVDNVAFTRQLEGCNNYLRKYINNGLVELEDSLRTHVKRVLDQELQLSFSGER